MKFIDLYNKYKNCADFKYRQKMFKMYAYLMKKSPGEFKIEWDDRVGVFRYFRKEKVKKLIAADGRFISNFQWEEQENSDVKCKYKTMGDYIYKW